VAVEVVLVAVEDVELALIEGVKLADVVIVEKDDDDVMVALALELGNPLAEEDDDTRLDELLVLFGNRPAELLLVASEDLNE
jgi:hypothetical protein